IGVSPTCVNTQTILHVKTAPFLLYILSNSYPFFSCIYSFYPDLCGYASSYIFMFIICGYLYSNSSYSFKPQLCFLGSLSLRKQALSPVVRLSSCRATG